MKKVVFANEEVYHVFNRSIDKRPILTKKENSQISKNALFKNMSEVEMQLKQLVLQVTPIQPLEV